MSRPILRILIAGVFLGLLAAGCSDDSPNGPSPLPCTYAFAPPNATFTSAGGNAVVQVNTQDTCDWTISSTVPWVTLPSGNSARGSASVAYRVAEHTGQGTRTGALQIGETVFPVAQTGLAPCTYDVTPLDLSVGSDAGDGSVHVATRADCDWTAAADVGWLTFRKDPPAWTGSGTVVFDIARNEAREARTGHMQIAGHTVTVTQAPAPPGPEVCEYSAGPADMRLHWHQDFGRFTVTTGDTCAWTMRSPEPWLRVPDPLDRQGPADVRFAVDVFTGGGTRRAAIEVRWPAETAGQNIWVNQDGCSYVLGPDVRDVDATGGATQITVIATPVSVDCMVGCPWQAESLAAWITITSSMPKAGDDLLFFTVAPNTTGDPRTGYVRVFHPAGELVLTVRQAK